MVKVTHHAIARYRERHVPQASTIDATAHIRRIAKSAPGWVNRSTWYENGIGVCIVRTGSTRHVVTVV